MPKRMLETQLGRPGFTLVELLTVVGVIAVLAALLLAGVSAARAKARESACISQLRQLGKAFQMYLDDYRARPPHLYELWPSYVSDRQLFVCPADAWVRQGGWAWSAWKRYSTPPQKWPFPISYGYFFTPDLSDYWWEAARAAPGRPGYVICVLHGTPIDNISPDDAPLFRGRTLRLCFDGSVIVRDIRPRRGGASAWMWMTDQEDLPREAP